MVTDMILGNPGKVDCSPFSIKHRFSRNFGTYFGHNYIFYKKNHVFCDSDFCCLQYSSKLRLFFIPWQLIFETTFFILCSSLVAHLVFFPIHSYWFADWSNLYLNSKSFTLIHFRLIHHSSRCCEAHHSSVQILMKWNYRSSSRN